MLERCCCRTRAGQAVAGQAAQGCNRAGPAQLGTLWEGGSRMERPGCSRAGSAVAERGGEEEEQEESMTT